MKTSLLASCQLFGSARACVFQAGGDRHPWLSAGQDYDGPLTGHADTGTVLHSHAFAALRAATCINLLGVQAESSDQAVPMCGDLAMAEQSLL